MSCKLERLLVDSEKKVAAQLSVSSSIILHDVEDEEIVNISENQYIVDAKIELEEFISFFNLKIDPLTVDAETLGGLFISEFGVLPEIEDKISIEKLTIKVSDTDGRRIKKFVVTTNT